MRFQAKQARDIRTLNSLGYALVARGRGRSPRVVEEREVLVQRLNQGEPGQLGKITRLMAEAGVNIETLYSDHDHQLILVVDSTEKGKAVSEAWTRRS